MILSLSWPLTPGSPLYPNTPLPVIQPVRSMDRGDSANTSTITFSTHAGTHIDAPRHFCEQGRSILEYFSEPVPFFPVHCIDIPLPRSREIGVQDLEGQIARVQDAEALFIRTGWDAIRSEDPARYCNDHPWVSPEVPEFLRKKCPGLRMFGLDQISVSSPLHREAGHACHRHFLCSTPPILILEDLNLSDKRLITPFRMHVYPYFIDRIDGIPVTVIAEIPGQG